MPIVLDIEDPMQDNLNINRVDAMITAFMNICEEAGYYCVLPFTEEITGLELSEKSERNCKLVYRIAKGGGVLFYGAYSPERDYGDGYVIIPFRSVFGGITAQIQIGMQRENL